MADLPEVLIGLGEIAAYLRCSRRTAGVYIRHKGLPAMRRRGTTGNTWSTTKTLINQWILAQSNARNAHADKD
jgi:hypothetical protein